LSGEFSLRPLDHDRDLARVHAWMNDAEVARFWHKAWPVDQVAAYLRDQQASSHSAPYVGEFDGVPMSYWELYRADHDSLAQYYPAREHDTGIHLLLGPTEWRGRGLAGPLLRLVSDCLLATDPQATRVVAEPDVENMRSVRAFERAGFRRVADIDLPTKRAALMFRDRQPNAEVNAPR
jgi:RimJ/RimL family protein N-acetyltransferase